MHTILEKNQLSPDIFQLKVLAPLIAQERKPGQFVILQLHADFGERIPLTIADADTTTGSITLIFQTAGKTTSQLSTMDVGDEIPILVGPLGTPTHIQNYGSVVCVGGGIGIAPLFPIAEALFNAGNSLTTIIGSQSSSKLFYTAELEAVSAELKICTDDGSTGEKGFVTTVLQKICEQNPPDLVIAIGPAPMMQACCEVTRPFGVKTLVSLNSIMIDGTGMCGGCRVTVNNTTQFVCVDGPEFDGHLVEWKNMGARLKTFKAQEHQNHRCKLPGKESPVVTEGNHE